MPKKRNESVKNYFDEREELAVLEYLYGDEKNRDKVFNEVLNEPFRKMIESIMKKYTKDILNYASVDELINDTLSFLLTKFSKFNPDNNNKAYSYYGTVCKHYLISQLYKYSKEKNRNISYEDISSDIEENEKYTYEMEVEEKVEIIDFIPMISKEIKNEIEFNKKIKPNEKKVGQALIVILDNWQKMITNGDKSNILARNKILYEIREATFLTSKEVRNALKKYKSIYEILKKSIYID